MYARLQCTPPLGRATVVSASQGAVPFSVIVETSASYDRSLEVALWHNFNSRDEWDSLNLQPTDEKSKLFAGTEPPQNVRRHAFSVDLTGKPSHKGAVSFTVKFRAVGDEHWKWAYDQFAAKDGQLFFQVSQPPGTELSSYIDDIDPSLSIQEESSQCPGSQLWSVTGSVDSASGSQSGLSSYKLGKPSASGRWFALERLWTPWLSPKQGSDLFSPDKDAILASFLRTDGYHVVTLALSGVEDVLTIFRHDGHGNIIIHGQNDALEKGKSIILVAVSHDFEIANAAVMYHARKLVTSYDSTAEEIANEYKAVDNDKAKVQWLEEWYDGLTYCTWNGLGQQLTSQRIYDALDELDKSGISITNLIIDDNWQSLTNPGAENNERAWIEFEADREMFPEGLAKTTATIRGKHKNIRHIAVWHAILGYWGGIAPEGKIAKEYKTVEVDLKPGFTGGHATVVDKEDVPRMYQDFYQFLVQSGIDSVKTDAQFFLDELTEAQHRRRLTKVYQDSWSLNHLRYLSAKAISCMSLAPQILFHSMLPTNKPRLLVRNSDDFFPEVPESHPWHIFCNAHVSLLTQHLNVLPDWDMFQTSHEWGAFHSAARCVSGGPIYFTDEPGKHNMDLIHAMTAKTPRGDTVILRPHTVGKSLEPYNAYHEPALLKVGTFVGRSGTGTGIIGIFNCFKESVSEFIRLGSFPGVEEGPYVLRAHSTGKTTDPLLVKDRFAGAQIELAWQGWEIISAYAVRSFTLDRKDSASGSADIAVANLGLIGKMTGAAAVVNTDVHIAENGRLSIWTSLKALGVYGVYISDLKNRSLDDDLMAVMFGQPIPKKFVHVDAENSVLSLDLDAAWKESDRKAGWSNEVAVEVLVR